MCLAAVYAQDDNAGVKELVLDKVQLIEVEGNELTCTSLFGETVKLSGRLTRVDLGNSAVYLRRT